ncbi:MAG: aminoacyl-tRNA hydrolase [Sedimentisphaerales bacterium]|nr:aminoacyl-tRNA hydrolase [Sedimentisphaerales bacterium]
MSQKEISKYFIIPENELIFKASRSSGPGGQNVNKLNTRITLLFNIVKSMSFSDEQKKRMLERLSKRIDKDGFIHVVSQKFRSQQANKISAVERLHKLLFDALKIKTIRKETKVPYAAKQKRLDQKKYQSQLKRQRADRNFDF